MLSKRRIVPESITSGECWIAVPLLRQFVALMMQRIYFLYGLPLTKKPGANLPRASKINPVLSAAAAGAARAIVTARTYAGLLAWISLQLSG